MAYNYDKKIWVNGQWEDLSPLSSTTSANEGKVAKVDSDGKWGINYEDIEIYSITDGTTTMAQLCTLLSGFKTAGRHVLFDVSTLKSRINLCTMFMDNYNNPFTFYLNEVNLGETHETAYSATVTLQEILNSYETIAAYGVEVDYENNTFTRLADAVGKTAGTDFDSINAFGGRKRCILTDGGVVLAYYGDEGYTETGALTQAITKDGTTYPVGTLVQVMVQQPKFYYKVVPITIEAISGGSGYHMRKGQYYVSDVLKEGFKVHPAFVCNEEENDYIYLSAYEACAYDVSASAYITDDSAFTSSEDKLSSIANVKPMSGMNATFTRATGRTMAANRGTAWSQATIQSVSATQLLFMIEYAYLNTQAKLGDGVVNKTDDGSTNMAENTGATTTLGNASGSVTNPNGYNVPSYRGEENWYGNIWEWIDGINIHNDDVSVHIADHGFTDNTDASPYADAGITFASANGWVKAFAYSANYDWLFIPSEIGGNSALPVGDNFYQNITSGGWRVARVGRRWSDGAFAGGFCWDLYGGSSDSNRNMGGRLLYVPNRAS